MRISTYSGTNQVLIAGVGMLTQQMEKNITVKLYGFLKMCITGKQL